MTTHDQLSIHISFRNGITLSFGLWISFSLFRRLGRKSRANWAAFGLRWQSAITAPKSSLKRKRITSKPSTWSTRISSCLCGDLCPRRTGKLLCYPSCNQYIQNVSHAVSSVYSCHIIYGCHLLLSFIALTYTINCCHLPYFVLYNVYRCNLYHAERKSSWISRSSAICTFHFSKIYKRTIQTISAAVSKDTATSFSFMATTARCWLRHRTTSNR